MIQHHNKQVGKSGILKIIIEGKGFQRHAMKSKIIRKEEKWRNLFSIKYRIIDHMKYICFSLSTSCEKQQVREQQKLLAFMKG